ncbi:TPA: LOW QUALITY PROTEIN: hypothetical protein N0F65_000998 [Lagenidium giganteum]|uniref:Uncharacterized protein n=1 Tax=Lagenidium giganteum TaxID=4803 RepID=A0AAV2YUY0_9STRA|nr:TPA: LOW QUALITY PROTEIN: hypothetical protein N0F65_000998 [Lagenidium giganteum]
MLALHVNAIVLVQPAVSPCTPWDHPVYAQVTSLHTEAMDVRHQRWLRQAVSFVADGGCRHGHVIKATPSRRVCDGEPSVFVDDASPVAPVVALISSKIALPVARYCADHVLELQHAILSRILGDTSTPAWRNIYAILHGLVPNAAHPVATDVLLWIDPRSGSIGAFRLQHAIDYAHFGDGDNATTGNEALGDSYQLDPADACRALAPYVISEEPVSSSHPLDGLFDVSVDDDVTCAAPDQAAVLPPSPARAKRAPGFARPLYVSPTMASDRSNGDAQSSSKDLRVNKYAFHATPTQPAVHRAITRPSEQGKSAASFVDSFVNSSSHTLASCPEFSISSSVSVAFPLPTSSASRFGRSGVDLQNLSATVASPKPPILSSVHDVVDAVRCLIQFGARYFVKDVNDVVEHVLELLHAIATYEWPSADLPHLVYWINTQLEDFRSSIAASPTCLASHKVAALDKLSLPRYPGMVAENDGRGLKPSDDSSLAARNPNLPPCLKYISKVTCPFHSDTTCIMARRAHFVPVRIDVRVKAYVLTRLGGLKPLSWPRSCDTQTDHDMNQAVAVTAAEFSVPRSLEIQHALSSRLQKCRRPLSWIAPRVIGTVDMETVDHVTTWVVNQRASLEPLMQPQRGQCELDPRPNTALHVVRLRRLLTSYPQVDAVLAVAANGIAPGWSGVRPKPGVSVPNFRSCSQFLPAVLRATAGRTIFGGAPLHHCQHIVYSPFGAVEKAVYEIRQIHDLSAPRVKSVNEFTDQTSIPVFPFSRITALARRIEDLASQYPGLQICILKGDVKGVFRHLRMHSRHVHIFAGSIPRARHSDCGSCFAVWLDRLSHILWCVRARHDVPVNSTATVSDSQDSTPSSGLNGWTITSLSHARAHASHTYPWAQTATHACGRRTRTHTQLSGPRTLHQHQTQRHTPPGYPSNTQGRRCAPESYNYPFTSSTAPRQFTPCLCGTTWDDMPLSWFQVTLPAAVRKIYKIFFSAYSPTAWPSRPDAFLE